MTQTTFTQNRDLNLHQKATTQDQTQVKDVAFSEQVDATVRKFLELIYDQAVQSIIDDSHRQDTGSSIDKAGSSLTRYHVIDNAGEALQEQE